MDKFRNFMIGRYGYDKLGGAILVLSVVISIVGHIFWLPYTSFVCLALDILFIYRFLSRKEYARSRENRIFMNIWENIKEFFSRDRANYDYYTCPVCGTKFRVAKNRAQGYTAKHICPKCGNEW